MTQKDNLLVAKALREYAEFAIKNSDKISSEQGKALDRALRSCRGISDIDRVWVRWSYHAEKHGWLTDEEMISKNGKYTYPPHIYEEAVLLW